MDPGLPFVYDQRSRQRHKEELADPGQTTPTLPMSHLPREPGEAGTSSIDWPAALGNVENAKLALDALQGLVADAVFLDEEAYTNAATLQQYQLRLQVRRH